MDSAIANGAEDHPSDDGSRPSAGIPHLQRTLEQCDLLLRQAERSATELRRRAEEDAARIREETSAHVAWRLDLVAKVAGLQADEHRRRAEVEAKAVLEAAWRQAEALQLELLEEAEAEATAILERAERDAALLRRGAEQFLAEARAQRADIDLRSDVVEPPATAGRGTSDRAVSGQHVPSQREPGQREPGRGGLQQAASEQAASGSGEDAGTDADEPLPSQEDTPATEDAGRSWASRLVARSFLSVLLALVVAALAVAGSAVTPLALTMWW